MPPRKNLKDYILPFSIFKDQIYNTLQNDEERNELLWWSIYKDSKKGENRAEYLRRKEEFITSLLLRSEKMQSRKKNIRSIYANIEDEKLTNYIVGVEIENALRCQNLIYKTMKIDAPEAEFPDITLQDKNGKDVVHIEIKGLQSPSSIKKAVLTSVLPHLLKNAKYNEHFILLSLIRCQEGEGNLANEWKTGLFVFKDILELFNIKNDEGYSFNVGNEEDAINTFSQANNNIVVYDKKFLAIPVIQKNDVSGLEEIRDKIVRNIQIHRKFKALLQNNQAEL